MISQVLVGLIAVLHVYFFVLEAVLWRKPLGMKTFKTDPAFAERSATIAANQGVYNLFLSAGLVWGLIAVEPISFQVKVFFLACVIVAGLFGAATVSRRILFVQAVPAIIALALVLLSR